jgi:hypothetical protein
MYWTWTKQRSIRKPIRVRDDFQYIREGVEKNKSLFVITVAKCIAYAATVTDYKVSAGWNSRNHCTPTRGVL